MTGERKKIRQMNKKFKVSPGGYINWTGDPYNADININAIYNIKRVPLYDLTLDNLDNNDEVSQTSTSSTSSSSDSSSSSSTSSTSNTTSESARFSASVALIRKADSLICAFCSRRLFS